MREIRFWSATIMLVTFLLALANPPGAQAKDVQTSPSPDVYLDRSGLNELIFSNVIYGATLGWMTGRFITGISPWNCFSQNRSCRFMAACTLSLFCHWEKSLYCIFNADNCCPSYKLKNSPDKILLEVRSDMMWCISITKICLFSDNSATPVLHNGALPK